MVDGLLRRIQGGIIVSCQAREGSPLHGPQFMAAMAVAAAHGGAAGIRADGPEDIRAIRRAISLPIIGIYKRRDLSPNVYITPDVASALAVIQAGADIVAVDGTSRPRPGGITLARLVAAIKSTHSALVMADIATAEEALAAVAAGADIVATTLSGYTPPTAHKRTGPDLDLIKELVDGIGVPVIAEGRFWTPEEVCQAVRLGAHAVVVGTAITNPEAITARFAQALAALKQHTHG